MTTVQTTQTQNQDLTPTGLKLEGPWENDRNSIHSELFKSIIREVYGVKDVICGHHLVYQIEDKRSDGYTYQIVEEVPSADTLIFDHCAARKLWGPSFKTVLSMLAMEPVETRDALLAKLYTTRLEPGTNPLANPLQIK